MTDLRKSYDWIMHNYEILRHKLEERKDVFDLIILNLIGAACVYIISISSVPENRITAILALVLVVFGIIRKIKIIVK